MLYVAPELLTGRSKPEVHADCFSLGALACLLLTGSPPAANATARLQRLSLAGGLDIRDGAPGLPSELVSLVFDATRMSRSDRTGSAAQFGQALSALSGSAPGNSKTQISVMDPASLDAGDFMGDGPYCLKTACSRNLVRDVHGTESSRSTGAQDQH
jgi:hypothetical protein